MRSSAHCVLLSEFIRTRSITKWWFMLFTSPHPKKPPYAHCGGSFAPGKHRETRETGSQSHVCLKTQGLGGGCICREESIVKKELNCQSFIHCMPQVIFKEMNLVGVERHRGGGICLGELTSSQMTGPIHSHQSHILQVESAS